MTPFVPVAALLSCSLAGQPACAAVVSGAATRQAIVSQSSVQTAIFRIDSMDCALCPLTIRMAMGRVPGVVSVAADLGSRTARVQFDPTRTSPPVIARASADAGYPPTRIAVLRGAQARQPKPSETP